MPNGLLTASYIAAAILFILSLGGLSKQESAGRGNTYGIIGMLIAIAATAASGAGLFEGHAAIFHGSIYTLLFAAIAAGAGIGAFMAGRVAMTSMPELVAMLHSFVGLAAVLVGISTYLQPIIEPANHVIHNIEIYLDVFIGAITLTGSIIAFLKLKGSMSGKPLLLPGRHMLNLAVVIACLVLAVLFVQAGHEDGIHYLLIMTFLAGLIGVHMVMAIGGADMPVVVSMLNSYSGWAAAAAGFMLNNDALIVTGALVGSSGAILSHIMCKAMNRSFISVILGGFGSNSGGTSKVPKDRGEVGEVHEIDVTGTAALLDEAKRVIIVPGYGMAVAQAQQHSLAAMMVKKLRDQGVDVKFGLRSTLSRAAYARTHERAT